MKGFAIALFITGLFISSSSVTALRPCTHSIAPRPKDSLGGNQLLVVVTDGWDSLRGYLFGFEKQKGKWVQLFSHSVVVGSNGLGIGDGIVHLTVKGARVKKEGDLRSPAGVFTIGTAFGYADNKDAQWIKNPYIKSTDTFICVDDPGSAHYNTLVNNDPASSDWHSFEQMRRNDDYYKWGLFINHNAPKTIAGDGSCIFLHIWQNDHTGTSGCTAMAEENLLTVLHWIDGSMHPLLVQMPKPEYAKLAAKYQLPQLPLQ
ncbi:MAG TPA: L,D-transpeptidase family protein [Puia sp.]|jgi:L,D-peptidoglycan transpeptidase YkuD (ErfK/YbiS/YcfS/YnhG family)|nr:L,D-transpeptidase family protein [Puia sp.]